MYWKPLLQPGGSYSVLVAYMLTQTKVIISVINPKQIGPPSGHHFAKMHLSVTKTDPRDAVLLSEYGRVVQPAAYQMSNNSLLLLRQKRTLLRQYQKQRVVLLNLLESFELLPPKRHYCSAEFTADDRSFLGRYRATKGGN